MKTFALLLLVVAVGLAKNIANRATITAAADNGSVTIDNNPEIAGAVSRLDVTCINNQAVLSLVRPAGSTVAGDARIQIGNSATPDASCVRERLAIPVEPVAEGADLTITATAGLCGGTTNLVGSTEYTWTVQLTEFYPVVPGNTITRPVESSFPVTCKSDAQAPPPGPDQPPVETLVGTGVQSAQTIPFILDSVASNANPRLWLLNLRPTNNVNLRGLSYRIVDFTATATQIAENPADEPTVLSAKLIDNGCIRDTTGVRAVKGTAADGTANAEAITISVARFQFTDSPTAPVSFTATVALCTPDVTGTVCEPVAGCPAPVVNPKKTSADSRNLMNGSQNTAVIKTASAVESSRPRRSLNKLSLGQLTAQLV